MTVGMKTITKNMGIQKKMCYTFQFPAANTFPTDNRGWFKCLTTRSLGGLIPDINNSTLQSIFEFKKHFTSFLSCIYSPCFTFQILEVCKTDAFWWGFAEKTKLFLLFCCSSVQCGWRGGRKVKRWRQSPLPLHPYTSLLGKKGSSHCSGLKEHSLTPHFLYLLPLVQKHLKETLFIYF